MYVCMYCRHKLCSVRQGFQGLFRSVGWVVGVVGRLLGRGKGASSGKQRMDWPCGADGETAGNCRTASSQEGEFDRCSRYRTAVLLQARIVLWVRIKKWMETEMDGVMEMASQLRGMQWEAAED